MNRIHLEIGQILKQRRIKKKLLIEKISNKTKISIQNLINIEEGDFHLIAGKFYQRSFVKAYCEALKISDKKILSLLDTEDSANIEVKPKEFKDTDVISNEKIPTKPLVLVATLGLVVIFLFNFIYNKPQSGKNLAKIEPKKELEISKIEENIINEIESIKPDLPIVKQTKVDLDEINKLKRNENNFFLKQIKAKKDVWIEIKDNDENILVSTILMKDETFNIPKDKENVIISTSDAGALYLRNENNNQEITLGSSGIILDSVKLNSLITNH